MKIKKIIIALMLFVVVSSSHAQDNITFQKISFAEAKKQAKGTGKLIFLDGYTSWCAPCKWMEGNVFNQKEVADFYNTNFINTKFDCEVGEGIDIAKMYGINSFPTYLFLDAEGTLVYRTQSRMEVNAFLKEGQQAADRNFHIPVLQARFLKGESNPAFLLRYITVMSALDAEGTKAARKKLDVQADDTFLRSAMGWQAIRQLGQSGNDKYSEFFLANKTFFKESVPQAEFQQKEQQLLRYAMYGYIRNRDKAEFDKGIAFFEQSNDVDKKIEAAMFQVDWVTSYGTDQEFVQLTNTLRKGILKDQTEKLTFIARRNSSKSNKKGGTSPDILKQCYVLAKQAVKLDEDSYSAQGTFAEVCILLNKKKEAVKAAEAARALAESETSKIIKIADALLDRAKAL